jgi:hypothetical protein
MIFLSHKIVPVTSHNLWLFILCSLCLTAAARSFSAGPEASGARVRSIIVQSRHLGAHGMGYSGQSLIELSRKLTPADIPALMPLVSDRELRTGVQFALASQCEPAIAPVREAAAQRRMDFLDAFGVMELISGFDGCTPRARERARAAQVELETLRRDYQAKAQQKTQQQADDDARIQRNALKMMQNPRQAAQELSREEREEIYRRSLTAMGLKEDGPMTPQQKELVQRMYRTMVLGEPGAPSSNTPTK